MAATQRGLTQKQERFAEAYVVTGNASEAYRRAYSTARMKAESIHTNAARLLSNERVAERISELQGAAAEAAVLSAADVLLEIRRLALNDPRRLVHPDGRLKKLHELDADTAACISGIDIEKDGTIKYRFWDKGSALEKAAKHLGLYERDNKQKADPLASLLERVCSSNGNGFAPVAQDPDHDED